MNNGINIIGQLLNKIINSMHIHCEYKYCINIKVKNKTCTYMIFFTKPINTSQIMHSSFALLIIYRNII